MLEGNQARRVQVLFGIGCLTFRRRRVPQLGTTKTRKQAIASRGLRRRWNATGCKRENWGRADGTESYERMKF